MAEEMGRPLFLKRRNSWQITEDGRKLYQAAKSFNDQVARLASERELKSEREYSVNLTCAGYFLEDYIIPSLPTFHKRYPNILLNFYIWDLRLSLAYGEVDIAIRHARPREGLLIGKRVGMERVGAISHKREPSQQWIGLTNEMDWAPEMEQSFQVFKRQPVYRMPGYVTIRSAMEATGYSGVLPYSCIHDHPDFAPVKAVSEMIERPLWLVYHETRRNDPILALVLSFLEETVRSTSEHLESSTI